MILFAGADVVTPAGRLPRASVVVDGDRIVAVEPRVIDTPSGAARVDGSGGLLVPGFVDVHVHGVEGIDVLDGPDAVTAVAQRLPRYGVTAFCPTSVACTPQDLAVLLDAVSSAASAGAGARVLGAHLESNFINPAYRGAQPAECLRWPPRVTDIPRLPRPALPADAGFSGADILTTIVARERAVAIVTLAPEIEGGLDLVRHLVDRGHRVSLGHTGATLEMALEAIALGARHATHLFNRMTPLGHRAPGVAGAVLTSEAVAAEIICDGFHVHPAVVRLAFAAKGARKVLAITDGTAGSGLPPGSHAHLGRQPIVVTSRTAELIDGTLAGSVLTMDRALRVLVGEVGVTLVDAVHACATTPAREMGLAGAGTIEVGALADLVLLDGQLRVRATYVGGRSAFGIEPD
jgi:N-acetylglucosamine-6-phosphate deacetylase